MVFRDYCLPLREHLTISGHIFGVLARSRGYCVSSGRRPGILQNILHCTKQPSTTKINQPKMSIVVCYWETQTYRILLLRSMVFSIKVLLVIILCCRKKRYVCINIDCISCGHNILNVKSIQVSFFFLSLQLLLVYSWSTYIYYNFE